MSGPLNVVRFSLACIGVAEELLFQCAAKTDFVVFLFCQKASKAKQLCLEIIQY